MVEGVLVKGNSDGFLPSSAEASLHMGWRVEFEESVAVHKRINE
jgi:hypothetical protein